MQSAVAAFTRFVVERERKRAHARKLRRAKYKRYVAKLHASGKRLTRAQYMKVFGKRSREAHRNGSVVRGDHGQILKITPR